MSRRILAIGRVLGSGVVLVACAALSLSAWSSDSHSPAVETNSTRAPVAAEMGAVRADAKRFATLIAREVPTDTAIMVEVTQADLQSPLAPGERRYQVGVTKSVGSQVDFSNLRPGDLEATPRRHAQGAIRGDGRGGFSWTGVVESPGAAALRVRFDHFFLPRHAELYLHGDTGEVFGPYTGRGVHGDGEFWSHTVSGSRVTLALSYTGVDTARALGAARYLIADVAHLDHRFRLARSGPDGDEQAGDGFCPFNEPCIENAECSSLDSAIAPAADAVAQILFQARSGPVRGYFICSGGLVSDTDASSVIPYFLTANHCISKGREARSAETFFDYKTPCGGGCSFPSVASTLGSSIVKTGSPSDYTLLRLDQQPPAGSVLLGWNSTPIAFDDGAPLSRISHPAGAPQAYSEHEVDTARATCAGWPRGGWIYSSDTFGGTEGGSSGSPVLNSAGQIVGQLSGACGFNVNDSCDSVANATVDGALAAYFSDISQFLDPNTSCTDADNDGSCVETGDCDDANPSVHPGAAELCDDGVDNDCNGLVDSADPACQTGTCDLAAVGDSCASASECCSAKCKGKPAAGPAADRDDSRRPASVPVRYQKVSDNGRA